MSYAIDYAFARPSPPAIAAAGYTGVFRYVCQQNGQTQGKIITPAEMAALRAAGLDVTLNYEWYEKRPTEGYAAGVADAQVANQLAYSVGYPTACAIYYSVDFQATWPQVSEYFRGVHDTSKHPVGLYGGIPLILAARQAGYAPYGWATNAASWSGRTTWQEVYTWAVQTGVHVVQHLHSNTPYPIAGTPTLSYDPNTILVPEYGQWHAHEGADDMTPEESSALYEINHNLFQGAGHSLLQDMLGILGDPKLIDGKSVLAKLEEMQTQIEALKVGGVDMDALATKVADKLAQRLQS